MCSVRRALYYCENGCFEMYFDCIAIKILLYRHIHLQYVVEDCHILWILLYHFVYKQRALNIPQVQWVFQHVSCLSPCSLPSITTFLCYDGLWNALSQCRCSLYSFSLIGVEYITSTMSNLLFILYFTLSFTFYHIISVLCWHMKCTNHVHTPNIYVCHIAQSHNGM